MGSQVASTVHLPLEDGGLGRYTAHGLPALAYASAQAFHLLPERIGNLVGYTGGLEQAAVQVHQG